MALFSQRAFDKIKAKPFQSTKVGDSHYYRLFVCKNKNGRFVISGVYVVVVGTCYTQQTRCQGKCFRFGLFASKNNGPGETASIVLLLK